MLIGVRRAPDYLGSRWTKLLPSIQYWGRALLIHRISHTFGPAFAKDIQDAERLLAHCADSGITDEDYKQIFSRRLGGGARALADPFTAFRVALVLAVLTTVDDIAQACFRAAAAHREETFEDVIVATARVFEVLCMMLTDSADNMLRMVMEYHPHAEEPSGAEDARRQSRRLVHLAGGELFAKFVPTWGQQPFKVVVENLRYQASAALPADASRRQRLCKSQRAVSGIREPDVDWVRLSRGYIVEGVQRRCCFDRPFSALNLNRALALCVRCESGAAVAHCVAAFFKLATLTFVKNARIATLEEEAQHAYSKRQAKPLAVQGWACAFGMTAVDSVLERGRRWFADTRDPLAQAQAAEVNRDDCAMYAALSRPDSVRAQVGEFCQFSTKCNSRPYARTSSVEVIGYNL